jgi:hypothetical protein
VADMAAAAAWPQIFTFACQRIWKALWRGSLSLRWAGTAAAAAKAVQVDRVGIAAAAPNPAGMELKAVTANPDVTTCRERAARTARARSFF